MRLGPAPALIVRPEGEPRATLLWYHGLGVSKETHQPELERFARAGILAVGIDAAGHGERRLENFEERFAPPREVIEPLLFQLVDESVQEIPSIIDALGVDRVALCGISFGGYIAYRGAVSDPRIDAVVTLLGSPEPSLADAFFPRALLSLTAQHDVNVPPDAARAFHRELEPRYASVPERLAYHQYPDATHFLPEEAWIDALDRTIAWVLRFAR
ncbi:MAG TPA: alpha/beta fold hydrolase [Thermoanaerobaculia bacterium]|nr:alpha/beta fold hydrolase [Thermoanaerobaculia bacterium]